MDGFEEWNAGAVALGAPVVRDFAVAELKKLSEVGKASESPEAAGVFAE
jgi:hypothetical protein